MPIYIDAVFFLNFMVDFLLLLGTNRLCGHTPAPGRAALAAVVGGIYGCACLLPGFSFLGNFLWRMVSLAILSLVAFGYHKSALRRGIVFAFLCMALGGLALGMNGTGIWSLVASAGGLFLICRFGFRGRISGKELVPVELSYHETKVKLTALRDTGNALRDPITGVSVLVIGAEAAHKLTGLTIQQMKKPIESIGVIPGLRLVPYRTVGNDSGMLLALRIPKVKIGTWQGSSLVAFAPEGLQPGEEYQALIGGYI